MDEERVHHGYNALEGNLRSSDARELLRLRINNILVWETLPVMDSRKDTLSPMCGEFLRDPLNIL